MLTAARWERGPIDGHPKVVAALSVVGVLASLVSCSSSSTPASGVSSASLDDKTFVSTSVTGHNLVPGTTVTFKFEGPTLAVSAGSNTMSGAYIAPSFIVLEPPMHAE